MQAIKAVYDGVNFTPKQPVPVQGHYEVVILFLEPTEPDKSDESATLKSNIDFWQEYKKLLADSNDEILSPDDFTRSKISRDLIIFDDNE